MKLILGPRASGKTTRLIQMSAVNGHTIVTNSGRSVVSILRAAERMGVIIPTPITYDDLLRLTWRGKRPNGFLIDDIDRLLWVICGSEAPVAITFSPNENIETLTLPTEMRKHLDGLWELPE